MIGLAEILIEMDWNLVTRLAEILVEMDWDSVTLLESQVATRVTLAAEDWKLTKITQILSISITYQ